MSSKESILQARLALIQPPRPPWLQAQLLPQVCRMGDWGCIVWGVISANGSQPSFCKQVEPITRAPPPPPPHPHSPDSSHKYAVSVGFPTRSGSLNSHYKHTIQHSNEYVSRKWLHYLVLYFSLAWLAAFESTTLPRSSLELRKLHWPLPFSICCCVFFFLGERVP